MRIVYFDPYSGASGDMVLAALIDAGVEPDVIGVGLSSLPIKGLTIRAMPVRSAAIAGTKVQIEAPDDQAHRSWSDIRTLILGSTLAPPVKETALGIFSRLAEAEAAVHGVPIDDVHFHEVGGVDAIADICGAAIGLAALDVEAIYCGPIAVGDGFVTSSHGLLPVPAPATGALLAGSGATIAAQPTSAGELLTPTGAAILTTVARFNRPEFRPLAIGYGFGARELPWPNALRLFVGETDQDDRTDELSDRGLLLETNIDDMNPQAYELLLERVFAAGALDAWLTPIVMKKGRPAITVSALTAERNRLAVEQALLENSTTLGIRRLDVDRTLMQRRIETVVTRWGPVRLKLRGWRGRVVGVSPEYDDCARLARESDSPFQAIWDEAHRIGEGYAGTLMAGTELMRSTPAIPEPRS